jgi:hypothetical protein
MASANKAAGWRLRGLRIGRAACLGLLLGLLSACSASGERQAVKGQLLIDSLSFQNQSRSMISGIQLLVADTGEFVSCGNIPPGGVCANTFPGRVFRGSPVEVSWTQAGQAWSTGAMRLSVGDDVAAAGAATVQVVVVAPGSAGVLLVPEGRPGRP